MAKILVADDSAVVRKSLEIILKQLGHEIIAEVETGDDAYRVYSEKKPDLVTMDINMPGIDGINAVKKIIGEFPDAKIIMVSSEAHDEKVKEAIKSGAKDYVTKPFKMEALSEIIKKVL